MWSSAKKWAWEQIGEARVGDLRCKRGLLRLMARAAEHPGGTVAEVVEDHREREAAYDLLEAGRVECEQVAGAIAAATVRQCAADPFVFVPIDGSSVRTAGKHRGERFGALGAHCQGGRGVKVISALAVRPDATPLGLVAQRWWTRQQRSKLPDCRTRTVEQKETAYWLDALRQARAAFAANVRVTRAWFQIDREGDNLALLSDAIEHGDWITVRARHDRRLRHPGEPLRRWRAGGAPRLRQQLAKRRAAGRILLDVPAAPDRPARTAVLELRSAQVLLDRVERITSVVLPPIALNVVHVQEVDAPCGQRPLDWMLLTTVAAASFDDARRVVFGYAQRWRIEEFHRTWKRGLCNVERSQLRRVDSMVLWATILAAVATRIERLKHLARTQGEQPALVELDRYELKALQLLRKSYQRKPHRLRLDRLTIAQAVLWIADLGGYMGNPRSKPPGAVTIGRGLERLMTAAQVLRALDLPMQQPKPPQKDPGIPI